MRHIKESLGTVIAFGCEGAEKEVDLFENLCHNYSISDAPHRIFSTFSFVLTTPEKLLNGLALFNQNKHFINKDCEFGGLKIFSLQEAQNIIKNAKSEPFYTSYLRDKEKERYYVSFLTQNDKNYNNDKNYDDLNKIN